MRFIEEKIFAKKLLNFFDFYFVWRSFEKDWKERSMLINLWGISDVTARVAQSVERSAVNRKVGGSNPPVSDIFIIPHTRSILQYKEV